MRLPIQLAILIVGFSGVPHSQASKKQLPEHIAGLDEQVESAMKIMELPGLALTVVDQSGVVVAKGYGVRKKGDPDRVDEKTLFEIGSITKAFTATAIGRLVESGQITWQTPIKKHIPYFELNTPYITDVFTVADALSHRGGYRDSYFYDVVPNMTQKEFIRRLKFGKTSMPFRTGFEYHNALFAVAGKLIPELTGDSWSSYVQKQILTPLGMNATLVTDDKVSEQKNIAIPHVLTLDGMQSFSRRLDEVDIIPEVGAIISNANDMARWCQFQISDEERSAIINQKTHAEMRSQQTIGTFSWLGKWGYGNTRAGYGLGWMLFDYRGDEDQLVAHGGSVDGVQSWMVYSPKNKYCIAMMSNGDWSGDPVHFAIANWIQDRYLGLDKKNWNSNLQSEQEDMLEGLKQQALKKGKNSKIPFSQPISEYTGKYTNDSYGDLIVKREGAGLRIQLGNYQTVAEHWRGETFYLNWAQPGDPNAYVTFNVSPKGKITGVLLDWVGDQFEFTLVSNNVDTN
jgi:CubicO group peptidase (beta-lactamase class C family)